ncbi:hypothetical protein ACX0G9_02655 [Flavitalea flava]
MSHFPLTRNSAAMFRTLMARCIFLFVLLLAFCYGRSQIVPKEDLSPYYETINNIYKNRRLDRIYSRDIFVFSTEIRSMKTFFIKNASRALNPKPLACINTIRAGMETLFYGNSAIPFSKYSTSERPIFRISGSNRVIDLMKMLSDSGCINDYKDVYFLGKNLRGDTVVINENNFTDSLRVLTLAGSVWHAILSMLPRVKGWSVFCLSLSNGYHTAILAVNHTNFRNFEMYWADQTTHHPVYEKDRIPGIAGPQFGWERMMEHSSPEWRSLDDYCLYAVDQFLYSDPAEGINQAAGSRRHMPIIRIWKISKPPQAVSAPGGRH